MRARVRSGAFTLAITLSVVGAIVTDDGGNLSRALIASKVAAGKLAPLQFGVSAVPVRPGLISAQVEPDAIQAALPINIRIRGIDLEAPILSVGVDEVNQFDVPAADTVGWYKYSSLPGTSGASVLAAHVDYAGRPGAFFNLANLRAGDRVEIVMSDESILTFKVTGNTQYEKSSLPAEDLFRKDGEAVLQLITCGGTFDPEKRSYQANVVISAVPIRA